MLILPVITICVSVAATLAGTAMQSLYVSPDELNKESKYLKSNIEFTQKAYDLDSVNEIDFPASENLTAEGILENSATLSNVRINDFRRLNNSIIRHRVSAPITVSLMWT